MADLNEKQTKRHGNWGKVLLVVSLALNLLVIGAIGGALLSGGKWRSHHTAGMEGRGGPMVRALSHEDRHAMGDQMRAAMEDAGLSRVSRSQSYDALADALLSEPFDADLVRERMDAVQAPYQQRFKLGRSLLIDRLSAMSLEEREDYARRLKKTLHRRH